MIDYSALPMIPRRAEFEEVSALLKKDSDLVITGVPGVGRRTLIRAAANQLGTRCVEVDCLRARSAHQFVRLLADSLHAAFSHPDEQAVLHQWLLEQSPALVSVLARSPHNADRDPASLIGTIAPGKEWPLFERLLQLPPHLAEVLAGRIVMVFHNFSHIRAWDRHRKWETRLLQEIQQQTQVSYALVAIVSEPWMNEMGLPVIFLGPICDLDLRAWIVHAMAIAELDIAAESQSLALFLSYAQGHIKDAIALAQRIQLTCHIATAQSTATVATTAIEPHHVRSSMLALVKDIEVTFETLLLLLPPTQAKLLESLSLDPTDRPQSSAYIKKHYLSRGGSLQGALSSLEQKGLIYGPQLGYRVSLPLFDFWIKQSQLSWRSSDPKFESVRPGNLRRRCLNPDGSDLCP